MFVTVSFIESNAKKIDLPEILVNFIDKSKNNKIAPNTKDSLFLDGDININVDNFEETKYDIGIINIVTDVNDANFWSTRLILDGSVLNTNDDKNQLYIEICTIEPGVRYIDGRPEEVREEVRKFHDSVVKSTKINGKIDIF